MADWNLLKCYWCWSHSHLFIQRKSGITGLINGSQTKYKRWLQHYRCMYQMVWVHLEAHSKKLMTLMRAGTFIWHELIGNILTDQHRNVMKKSGKICTRLHTLDHNFICLMQYYHSSVFNFFGLLSILLVYVQVSKDNILPCEVHRGQVGVQCQHHGIWGHRAWYKSTMLVQRPVDWTGKAITFAVWSRWYNHLWNDWASTVQYNDLKSVNT